MVFINFIHYEVVSTVYCFIGSPLLAAKPLNALYAQQNRLARRLDCLILGNLLLFLKETVSYSVIRATKKTYKIYVSKSCINRQETVVSADYAHETLPFMYDIMQFLML
jgi:hypothetical protein